MEIHFGCDVPADDLALCGVDVIERGDPRVVLRISGEPGPLIRVLAHHDGRGGFWSFRRQEL